MSYAHRYQDTVSLSFPSQSVLGETDCVHVQAEETNAGEESNRQCDARGCEGKEGENSRCYNRPTCCKRLVNSFELNHPFHPQLNKASLKMLSRSSHASLPVVTRLAQVRRSQQEYHNPDLTFSPKLNSTSLKLARQRSTKIPEVQAKAAEMNAARLAEFYAEYTFKPHILKKTQQLADGVSKGLMTRQHSHPEKQQKLVS